MKSKTVRRPSSSLAVVTTPSGLWKASHRRSCTLTGFLPTVMRCRSGSTFMPERRRLPVHPDLALLDQLLGGPARRDSGPGQRPLEPHLAHDSASTYAAASSVAFGRGAMRPQRDRQLLGLGQIGQIPQPQQLEKERRGAVEERPAQRLAASDDLDQAALLQRAQHAAGRDPADLLDLQPADRLAVRDHRQRLERRGGELRACAPRTGPARSRRRAPGRVRI